MTASKYPSPAYLMGALIEDKVDPELALATAERYEQATAELDDSEREKWLHRILSHLDVGHSNTAMAVLAYPSDHDIEKYRTLAQSHGWKGAE